MHVLVFFVTRDIHFFVINELAENLVLPNLKSNPSFAYNEALYRGMAVRGSDRSTTDESMSDLQSRQRGSLIRANSASSSIGIPSFSFPGGFHSHSNGAQIEIVSQPEDVGGRAVRSRSHNFSVSIPFSAENATENGGVSSQIRHSGSAGQASSSGASLRRLFSLSSAYCLQLDDDVESEIVSQAGDTGDRALSRRVSQRDSTCFSFDDRVVFPIPEELLESSGFWNRDPSNLNTAYPVSPLASEIVTPPPTDALLRKKQEEKKDDLPFEYVAYLAHLAVFGILGVLTRYLLRKLFSPSVADVTSDQGILYLDLPSNMVGSFLMGWFGVVFKADISRLSDQIAIGLTTGYLGSLTTFSGWNQEMLELSVKGHWVLAVLGYVIGLFLAAYSIIFGVETAKGFRWLLGLVGKGSSVNKWRVTSSKHRDLVVLLVLLLIWGGLLAVSADLESKDFKNGGSSAQLWLGCLVGPLGVWIRWWLARLNGRGIGKAGWCKWIPFGTLLANVSAACVMAALATLKKAVNTKNCDTVATGIQFGLLGCLSTVSTLMAEFHAMRNSSHPWRAYAYAAITLVISFGLGTLIYSVPVWTKGYK